MSSRCRLCKVLHGVTMIVCWWVTLPLPRPAAPVRSCGSSFQWALRLRWQLLRGRLDARPVCDHGNHLVLVSEYIPGVCLPGCPVIYLYIPRRRWVALISSWSHWRRERVGRRGPNCPHAAQWQQLPPARATAMQQPAPRGGCYRDLRTGEPVPY